MKTAIGRTVRLRLSDPDAGYASKPLPNGWPELDGKLVRAADGLHGKIWYLMELFQPLAPGFNPLDSSLPAKYKSVPIRYLLLSPSPAMPTLQVPPDFIGECVSQKKTAPVLVSVGVEPRRLPRKISRDDSHLLFPTICAGDLEPAEPSTGENSRRRE
jgi:hypothetical protein